MIETNHKLNGGYTGKGNYLWGAALTLAWKSLVTDIIKEPIQINSTDPTARAITNNFNQAPITPAILSAESFYAKAGFGNPTVRAINQEVKAKFPEKTTEPLPEDLMPESIISYAYFLKKLLFTHPFSPKTVRFNEKEVAGFEGKSLDQKSQILVNQYKDKDNFIVEMLTKSTKDRFYIVKENQKMSAEEIMEKVGTLKKKGEKLGRHDTFQMPKVSLSIKRDIKELLGVPLANEAFKQYVFAKIFEILKLDIDEVGVKVQNEGVIVMEKGMPLPPLMRKHIVLDKSFWVVFREDDKHPYFIAYIANVEEKDN